MCIADEVPFEIPDSWEWARLKNLVIKEIKRGKSPKYASDGSVYVFAQKCNVKLGEIDISLAKFLDMRIFEKYPVEEYMVDEDIIINSTGNGTLGRIGMFRDSDRINDSIIVPDSHVTIIRACNQLKKDYLFYVLKYYQPFLEKLGEGSTNQTELRPSTIAELFIPIPPIKEQEQIVTKLLEVIPMVDLYGKKENALQAYNTDFPTRLKKSILQEAIQGKLIPQDPADEPASVLLERIHAEKERLIKAGKIKRNKHESVIFRRDNSHYEKLNDTERCIDDELPFEIPETWKWIRLGTLFQHNTGKALNASNKDGQKLTYITTSNLYWDRFVLDSLKEMFFTDSEIEKCTVQQGDLLVCEGGDIGRAAIWNRNMPMRIQNHIHRLRAYVPVCSRFFYYLFYLYKGAGWIGGKGIAIQGLSSNAIHNLLFPLPPLQEQFRIVEKIDNALQIVNAL